MLDICGKLRIILASHNCHYPHPQRPKYYLKKKKNFSSLIFNRLNQAELVQPNKLHFASNAPQLLQHYIIFRPIFTKLPLHLNNVWQNTISAYDQIAAMSTSTPSPPIRFGILSLKPPKSDFSGAYQALSSTTHTLRFQRNSKLAFILNASIKVSQFHYPNLTSLTLSFE